MLPAINVPPISPISSGDPPSVASSDAALFASIARGTSPVEARDAKRLLYERHARFLFAVFSRKTQRLLNLCSWTAEDLLQETFARAFERAASFRAEENIGGDRERQRTRAWLGRIAERLLADSLRASREVVGTPELESVADPGPPSSGSRGASLIHEALQHLSERERDILRVSALYMRVDQQHQRLPNEVAAEVAKRWGISNDNVRAIRRRALNKLRQRIGPSEPTPGGKS